VVAGDARYSSLVLCRRGLRAPLNHDVRRHVDSTVSINVPRTQDSGNSPEANADGWLDPRRTRIATRCTGAKCPDRHETTVLGLARDTSEMDSSICSMPVNGLAFEPPMDEQKPDARARTVHRKATVTAFGEKLFTAGSYLELTRCLRTMRS
jgi:hypothetical protein